MAFLYVNFKGDAVFRHSYSAGQEFDQNPKKYYLRRVLGWKERERNAALLFGRALEDAVQHYHENQGQGAVEEFERRWVVHEKKTDLKFTKRERDWKTLNRSGIEMIKLYAIRQPSLPIPFEARFQKEYIKEVFPGTRLAGIEFLGKIDALARVAPDHPLLPKVEWKKSNGLYRTVVVDYKTSGNDLPDIPGIVADDPQLKTYAWLSGYYDVAFAWFKKSLHVLQKGVSITLLDDVTSTDVKLPAGAEAVIAQVLDDERVYIVKNDFELEEANKAQGRKADGSLETTKVAKERLQIWLQQHAALIPHASVTRQRFQFNAGIVDPDEAEGAGRTVGRQIQQIVHSWETKQWEDRFAIRYPHDDTSDPYYVAFKRKDNIFRDNFFTQSTENDFFDETEVEAEAA